MASCGPPRPASAPARLSEGEPLEVAYASGTVELVSRAGIRQSLRRVGQGEGIFLGRFEGAPYDVGLAFGRLTRHRFAAQEDHLTRLLAALVPSPIVRSALLNLTTLRLRGITREMEPELLLTLTGAADAYEALPHRPAWPAFRRLVNLHALHDVSQRFVDAPALASACTGFLASPRATKRGVTLLARNFDFEGGAIFDRQKLVSVVIPEGRIPYLAVGFPGMLGVVSGFNREGIGVAINAIPGGETTSSGEPVTLLLASVLRNDRTLEGAIARIRKAKVFVSDLILLADGKTGEIAVIEKTPSAFALRMPGPEGWTAIANEAKDPTVRRRGRPLPAGSTSQRREARLRALLEAAMAAGGLDIEDAVAILRDRKNADGVELGPGNRNAIDGLITAHSVVFDLTRRRAYVAAYPHALGAYIPIDLDAVLANREAPSESRAVPEDPFLVSGGFARYREARAALARLRRLERERGPNWQEHALEEAERAAFLSPEFVEAKVRLGEQLARLGRPEPALALLDEALAHDPAPEPFRKAVREFRDALAERRPLPKSSLSAVQLPDELVEESAARDLSIAR